MPYYINCVVEMSVMGSIINEILSRNSTILQMVTNIFLIVSVIFIAIQAFLYKKDFVIRNKKLEAEKAIELAEVFGNEIIPLCEYLFYIYKVVGIEDIVSEIDSSKLKEFDEEELDRILSKSKQENLAALSKKITLEQLMNGKTTISQQYSDEIAVALETIKDKKLLQEIQSNPELKEKKEQLKHLHYQLYREFIKSKTTLLNKLEAFCMYFNSGVAEEEVVYQSLHQIFLKAVKLFYYEIAINNKNGKDKYFTNIIELYNSWNDRYTLKNKQETESKRKQIHKVKKINSTKK